MSALARLSLSFFRTLLPWFVLGLGLLATGISWNLTRESQLRLVKTDFLLHAECTTAEIRKRLGAYEQVLRGAVALFGATGSISQNQWRANVERLNITESVVGTQGVGFVKLIPDKEKPAHITAMRSDGITSYDIWPRGTRNVYAPVVYLEQMGQRIPRAIGFDMFTEPVRRAAMELARDQGTAVISGEVTFFQETDQKEHTGFLMYLPIYRSGVTPANLVARRTQLSGFVYTLIGLATLIGGTLDAQAANIDLEIFDGTILASESLLFDLDKSPSFLGKRAPSALSVLSTLDLPGRTWTLRYEALPEFVASREDQKPLLVLIGGALISFLLFSLKHQRPEANRDKHERDRHPRLPRRGNTDAGMASTDAAIPLGRRGVIRRR